MFNGLWAGFFWCAAAAGLYQWLILGNANVFSDLVTSLFAMAKLSAEIAIGLIGTLCLWMGIFRIAEQSGIVAKIAQGLAPLLSRLMPELPKNDPAYGSISLNIAANMLGLDNAATPLGLQAMKDLQRHNPTPESATNAQILFLVINTSSVTLLPVTIFMYRAQQGAANPTDVFIPILLATTCSTLVGIFTVCLIQKIRLWHPVILAYLIGLVVLVGGMAGYFYTLSAEQMQEQSSLLANILLFGSVVFFISYGHFKRVPVYECFIEGAKGGFDTAIKIIPYLVAMLVAIGVVRASGALQQLVDVLVWLGGLVGIDTRFVDALPTAAMKPFSGSGARAMMIETMNIHGADSFAGRLASIVQGSTETTFYVLAVYFGVVGIKLGRHAVFCGLCADMAGIVAAISIGYWFFG